MTPTASPTPCSLCNSSIIGVMTACNPNGTLHWTATVRNTGPCALTAAWTATRQLQRSVGTYKAVLTQSGTGSFPLGDSTVSGDFCTVSPANTTGLRTQFGINGSTGTCASSYTSSPIWPCAVQPTCTLGFNDLPADNPAYTAVTYLASAHVVSGYPDGRFLPDQPTTRAQAVAVLVHTFRLPLISPTTAHFRDLAPDDTTYVAIETAAAAGWVGGYPDGIFRPADPITREVLAALVVKAARWTLEHPSVGHSRDVPTANQFYALIETGYAHGIFGDKPGETFRPDAQAPRGELAQIIYRASVPAEPGEPAQPPKSSDHQQP